jgi:hypothetical protein
MSTFALALREEESTAVIRSKRPKKALICPIYAARTECSRP